MIEDNEIATALKTAANAQETADGKMSFYSESSTSANEGDLLIPNQDNGDYKAGKIYRYTNDAWDEVVYSQEIDTKIGKIYVGGRNLLQNSSNEVTRPIGTQNGEFI
jgi:hypothetical protein